MPDAHLHFTGIHIENVAGAIPPRDPPDDALIRTSLFRILGQNRLCSIATVTPEGRPHIHTAYFSYADSLDLFFLSHPRSLHSRNLLAHSVVALTVFSSAQQWTEPDEGLQLFGTCEQPAESWMQEAERSYANRFPAYASWKAGVALGDPASEYTLYRVRVRAIKILDEKAFGDAAFVCAEVA